MLVFFSFIERFDLYDGRLHNYCLLGNPRRLFVAGAGPSAVENLEEYQDQSQTCKQQKYGAGKYFTYVDVRLEILPDSVATNRSHGYFSETTDTM